MGSGDGYFKSNQQQYLWLNQLTVSDSQIFTLGFERLNQSVAGFANDTSVNFKNDKLFTNAVMASYNGQWGIHNVQASIRNDYNSQYGNFTTGSLGYAIDLTASWRASIAANTAFRAPTFNELYYPGNYSNPNLQPERSRNVEFGLRYTHASGEVGVTGFYNQITDLIVSQAPTYYPQNIDSATIKGLSFTASQDLGHSTSLQASFDLLSPYNTTNDTLLPFNAQRVLRLGGSHRIGDLSLNAGWFLTSSRQDGKYTLGGYGLVNLGASYALNNHLEFQLQWNNVLGKNYTLVRGYDTPGSNVFFNVKTTY